MGYANFSFYLYRDPVSVMITTAAAICDRCCGFCLAGTYDMIMMSLSLRVLCSNSVKLFYSSFYTPKYVNYAFIKVPIIILIFEENAAQHSHIIYLLNYLVSM